MKLWVYVVRRLILLVPTILGLTFLVFALEHLGGTAVFLAQYINPHLTGTARQRLVEELTLRFHLNEPVFVQYFYWLGAIFQGDWGTSTTIGQPVSTGFLWFMPNTILLTALASLFTWIVSVPIGVYSASRRDSILDQGVRVATFTLYSMPVFLIGFALFLTLGTSWHLLPSHGNVDDQLLPTIPDSWFDHNFSVSSPTHILAIDALLHPGSIAVVGATERAGYGARLLTTLLQTKFAGRLYPINPNRATVFELPCYASLLDLPEPPDLAVLIVPAAFALEPLRQAAQLGTRAAIVS